MNLADNITFYRKKIGLTQEELAEKCNVSRQAVTKWETGNSEPNVATLIELSNLFSIDLNTLISGDDDFYTIKRKDGKRAMRMLSVYFDEFMLRNYHGVKSVYISGRCIISELLYNFYCDDAGEVLDKYLIKNTTKEERENETYMKMFCSEEDFSNYVDGKIEIASIYEKYKTEIEKEEKKLNKEYKKVMDEPLYNLYNHDIVGGINRALNDKYFNWLYIEDVVKNIDLFLKANDINDFIRDILKKILEELSKLCKTKDLDELKKFLNQIESLEKLFYCHAVNGTY